MLESTIEFVAQATASSHFIFCFCNVIIVLLLIDRFRGDLNPSFTSSYPFPVALDSNVTLTQHDYNYAAPAKGKVSVRFMSEVAIAETAPPKDEREGANEKKDEETKEEEDTSVQPTSETVVTDSTTAATKEDGNECEDDNLEEEGAKKEDEDDSDELRMRIEQFINKINREWRAERLRTTNEFD